MYNLSEQEIDHILTQYKCRREKDKINYQKKKLNPEFIEKNRQKAKDWYHSNKERRQESYVNNKDFLNAKNHFYYYKKKDQIDKFKEKYQDKYNILLLHGYLSE